MSRKGFPRHALETLTTVLTDGTLPQEERLQRMRRKVLLLLTLLSSMTKACQGKNSCKEMSCYVGQNNAPKAKWRGSGLASNQHHACSLRAAGRSSATPSSLMTGRLSPMKRERLCRATAASQRPQC